MSVRRGPLLAILASLSFTAMVGFVKVVRADLSTFEVIFWRAAVALVLMLAFARPASFRVVNRRLLAGRVALGFTTMTCFYAAAKGLALADLTLISKLEPILIVIAAPLLLGRSERSGSGLWVVILLGVAGAAILLAPQLAVGSAYGLLALGGTVSSAGAHLSLRRLGATDSTRAIVFWFQAGLLLGSAAILAVIGHAPWPPEPALWPPLIAIGATATAGQLLITRAYAIERASLVATAAYSSVLWAFLADIFFFDLDPSLNALVGGALVVAGGLWLIRGRGTAPAGA